MGIIAAKIESTTTAIDVWEVFSTPVIENVTDCEQSTWYTLKDDTIKILALYWILFVLFQEYNKLLLCN